MPALRRAFFCSDSGWQQLRHTHKQYICILLYVFSLFFPTTGYRQLSGHWWLAWPCLYSLFCIALYLHSATDLLCWCFGLCAACFLVCIALIAIFPAFVYTAVAFSPSDLQLSFCNRSLVLFELVLLQLFIACWCI